MLNIAASQQDGKEIKKVKQADNKCCQNQCLELSQAAKKAFSLSPLSTQGRCVQTSGVA